MAGRTQQTGECSNPSPMNWSSLFGNSSSNLYDNGNLEWIETDLEQDVVEVPDDILDEGCERTLERTWKTKASYEISTDKDIFYFKFLEEDDRKMALEGGPLLIAALDQEGYKLGSKQNWQTSSLGSLPKKKNNRLDFAKVCIEVPVNAKYPDCLRFNLCNGNIAEVGVEYLWLPATCTICEKIGHKDDNCPSNANSASNANNAGNTSGARTAANTIGEGKCKNQHNNGVVDNHVVSNSAQVPNSVAYEPDSRKQLTICGQCRRSIPYG
ncbi:hypothetical protein IFM89_000606 [Coptis chinensis]|uniref:Uncharacterized protein n=1 Tax=Coptis chinensis TaxID=261450 RepID=A0A835HCA6_9MAGN|nr:hypothetical protein IFM89_000606 [Coptis chinensis]